MKCNNCGSQWKIADHLRMTVKTCPFCGHDLQQPEEKQDSHRSTICFTNRDDFNIVGNIVRGYHGLKPDVYIPEGIVETGSIRPGEGAFYSNGSIQKLTFPKSMKKINAKACYNCRNLQEVIIPEGVTTIGESAFYGCSSLKNIALPSSICSIEPDAFAQSGLVSIQFPPQLDRIWGGVFQGCGALEKVVIPGTIKEIGPSAFNSCSNLRVIDIQNGVRIIGPHAFAACTALAKIDLPHGLEEIGHGAFEDCFNLTSVSIPETVQKIEVIKWSYSPTEGPFLNCTGLYNITHPARFGAYSFIGCAYYNTIHKIEEDQMAIARERQRIQAERLKSGKCPDCDMKLSMLGRKCPKCGKRYK